MIKNPVAAGVNMQMDELRRLMVENHQRYLPVMDDTTLMGVVSFHDVAKGRARRAELREPHAQELHPQLAAEEDGRPDCSSGSAWRATDDRPFRAGPDGKRIKNTAYQTPVERLEAGAISRCRAAWEGGPDVPWVAASGAGVRKHQRITNGQMDLAESYPLACPPKSTSREFPPSSTCSTRVGRFAERTAGLHQHGQVHQLSRAGGVVRQFAAYLQGELKLAPAPASR